MSDGMDYGQSERSQWLSEIAALRADLAKARERADQYERDWYAAKNEFGAATKEVHDRALAAERAHTIALHEGDRFRRERAAAERARDEAVAALRVIESAARTDHKHQFNDLRAWLDARDIFNGDIDGGDGDELIALVARCALAASTGANGGDRG